MTRKKLPETLSYEKRESKTLMKLTPAVLPRYSQFCYLRYLYGTNIPRITRGPVMNTVIETINSSF